MMRFYFKVDVRQKAKILRKASLPSRITACPDDAQHIAGVPAANMPQLRPFPGADLVQAPLLLHAVLLNNSCILQVLGRPSQEHCNDAVRGCRWPFPCCLTATSIALLSTRSSWTAQGMPCWPLRSAEPLPSELAGCALFIFNKPTFAEYHWPTN